MSEIEQIRNIVSNIGRVKYDAGGVLEFVNNDYDVITVYYDVEDGHVWKISAK